MRTRDINGDDLNMSNMKQSLRTLDHTKLKSESEFSTGVELKDILVLNRVASGPDANQRENKERASRNSNKFRSLIRTMDEQLKH